MHPKLSRLYIHNYRCFLDFELRPEGRQLLLGYNGTGKSSIFDVLAAIQDLVVWNKNASAVFLRSDLPAFSDSKEQRFEIDVESEWGMFQYILRPIYIARRDTFEIKSETVTLDGKPLYEFVEGDVKVYRDDHTRPQEISYMSNSSFLASLEPKPTNKRLVWFKRFIEGIWILNLDPPRMSGTALEGKEFLERDASNFGDFCRNLLADDPESVQRAKETLAGVLDGFATIRTQQAGRARVLVVKWSRPGGEPYELDFDCLSDGQKVLIALYLILHGIARRATVLCLDEPDNFVSIREIQPFLAELSNISEDTGLQPFIISHSSEVIDYIGAAGAILLKRPDGAPTRIGALAPSTSLRLSELMARGWHVED